MQLANHPNRHDQFELTFWGSIDIPYRRYHKTLEQARAEAFRVYRDMDDTGAHLAIIYDAQTGEQLVTVIP